MMAERGDGLRMQRLFTTEGRDPYEGIAWTRRESRIVNPDGSVVFEMDDAEVPATWSQVATDIIVSKYFRKAGVPQLDADGDPVLDSEGNPVLGSEHSAKDVFNRLAETWRHWGEGYGYFGGPADAQTFEDEIKYMLANQMAAPNSPQWFNTGLSHKYGITGTRQGFWYVDEETGEVLPSPDAYSRPAPHACFIQSVADDLVNDGGIMDLWVREARLFKMGSGTGSNFSNLRAEGEPLAGGGKSSGLMSFLKIGDRAAGAIKSGGTTRRAAKMVILDTDHPDIEEFIAWKRDEEQKARLLIEHGGFPADFNGEAYMTVSGQNSNNSVRVDDRFIKAVAEDGDWDLINRLEGDVSKTVRARDLWEQIADAAWACADPGVQYHTTINEWHTCPADGEIRASNPCSEYMFLDDTACNLASINLGAFLDDASGRFNTDGYLHAIRLWTIVLEISVTMAHFPSRAIAQGSYDFRTLGLGYANLGSLLMRSGIPYDSDEGRAIAGALTAILTGEAYATSADMAKVRGPFPGFEKNRENMLRVIRNHRRAAYDETDFEGVGTTVSTIDPSHCPADLLDAAHRSWDRALGVGEQHGYRNAQISCLAPTGTIGLVMDCDTTGVEPDFALVKFKKLAGGGYFKIANQSIAPSLRRLGYEKHEILEILAYVVGTSSLENAPHINRRSLAEREFTAEDLAKIAKALPGAFELVNAFNAFTLGADTLERLGFTEEEYGTFEFRLLPALGFSKQQIRAANDFICGRQTIEGAPHLRAEHLAVFDCANRNGRYGERFIHHTGHIRMMAAAQPFISGAISKTINMPNEVTVEDVADAYMMSWELGVKAVALYRDGSKASQPLSASSDDGVSEEESEEVTEALQAESALAWGVWPNGTSPTQAYAHQPRPRFLLPARRTGWTQEARVGGHKVFLRSGEYDDGTLGEIFIDLAKEGATLRGVLASFAIAVSKGLQYGVPLEEYVDTFVYQTFEPRGIVEKHPNIKMANSIVDYVFRALGVEYLHRDELAQVPPDRSSSDLPEPPKGIAAEAGRQMKLSEAVKERDIEAQATAARFVDSDQPGPIQQPLSLVPVGTGNGSGMAEGMTREAALASAGQMIGGLMGDAPVCSSCGHMTIRNGACYVCLTCGDTTGCS
ncbi:MAG: adenosylcobalamin-dependent ribonucleoside-diphosphate reductase [bacterium]|nr:adenosylcobalamin-dependent ribonucleoside-diphosphate reductase [bacterium]MDE0353309.1 adenosylcobalamin-dependent ribonucleoside-diphosphate reductase [bacterium]